MTGKRASGALRQVAAAAVTLALMPVAAAHASDPVLGAAGDIACQSPSTPDTTDCRQSATAALLALEAPAVVAPLGDEQYNDGTLAEFDAVGAFNDTWGATHLPFHPVPGNHEYNVSNTAAGYFQYFGGQAPGADYSYDLGGWHIVALNSNCDDVGCANHDSNDGTVSAAELSWLDSDLDANAGKCTLAYWHHPLFSSGAVGGSPRVKPLWTTLYAHRADIVLNGHEHHYERFAPQDPSGVATSAGISEFIVGTGGHDIGQDPFSNPLAPNSEAHDDTHFGALFLTLHPHGYDWAFRSTDGTVLDSGSGTCHQPLPGGTVPASTPPSQPNAPLPQPEGRVTFRLVRRRNLAALLRSGLAIALTCPRACSAHAALEALRARAGGRTAIVRLGSGRRSLGRAGTAAIVIRLTAAGRRLLRSRRHQRLRIVVAVALAGGSGEWLTQPLSLRAAIRPPPRPAIP